MKSVIAAIILSLIPVSAQAQIPWKAIAVGDDGTYTYVDTGSVIRQGSKTGFRILEVRPTMSANNVLSSGGWYQTDCRRQQVEVVSLRLLAADNSVIRDFPHYNHTFPAIAGSNLEQIYRFGCGIWR